MDGSSEESWIKALEVVGSLEERTTATWIRGVVDSLVESRQRFFSTNPTIADTLRPSSMLNIGL